MINWWNNIEFINSIEERIQKCLTSLESKQLPYPIDWNYQFLATRVLWWIVAVVLPEPQGIVTLIVTLLKLLKQKADKQIGLILAAQEDWQGCGQHFDNNIHLFFRECYFLQGLFNQRRYAASTESWYWSKERPKISMLMPFVWTKFSCQFGTLLSILLEQFVPAV